MQQSQRKGKDQLTGTIFWKLDPIFVKYFHDGVEYK